MKFHRKNEECNGKNDLEIENNAIIKRKNAKKYGIMLRQVNLTLLCIRIFRRRENKCPSVLWYLYLIFLSGSMA